MLERCNATLLPVHEFLILFGGTNVEHLDDFWVYDTAARQWSGVEVVVSAPTIDGEQIRANSSQKFAAVLPADGSHGERIVLYGGYGQSPNAVFEVGLEEFGRAIRCDAVRQAFLGRILAVPQHAPSATDGAASTMASEAARARIAEIDRELATLQEERDRLVRLCGTSLNGE